MKSGRHFIAQAMNRHRLVMKALFFFFDMAERICLAAGFDELMKTLDQKEKRGYTLSDERRLI